MENQNIENLDIISTQTLGTISWNFEELKTNLKVNIAKYDNIEYDENNIIVAKKDIAGLKGLVKKITAARIGFKKKCLESYEPVEKEIQELINIIEKPIDKISKSIVDFEKKRIDDKRLEIKEFFDNKLPDTMKVYQKQIYSHLYNDKWENSSTSLKTYKDAINSGIEMISHDLETIKALNSENESDLHNVYFISFDISKVIQKNNELVEQLRKFREKETVRIEAETRAKIKAETELKAKQEREKNLRKEKAAAMLNPIKRETSMPSCSMDKILRKESTSAIFTTPIVEKTIIPTYLMGDIDDGCGDMDDGCGDICNTVKPTMFSETKPLTKKTYELPVTWEMYGTVIIDATSLEAAKNNFNEMADRIDLPFNKNYVENSFRLTSNDLDKLELMTKILN